MMRIVYPTDGSDRAREGAHLLASLPFHADSTITLLAVTPPDHGTPQEMRHALHATRDRIRASGARLDVRVRWGDPAEQILRESEAVSADLIVLGDSGLTNSARLLVYSVCDEVARRAQN